MRKITCFISSPGDVGQERLLALRVIERLQGEFASRVELAPIVWEHEPLRATAHFQDQIVRPSDTDIVICILWSRLGTRLPANYTRADGSAFQSGTEWEFEDAARAFRERGTPDLLVYRKTSAPVAQLESEDEVLARLAQKKSLEQFIDHWFGNPSSGFRAAFHTFDAPDKFEQILETHLRRYLGERLGALPATELGPKAGTWHRGTPFRGLQPFDVAHADVFFGRTRATSELQIQLARQAAKGRAFVLVVGMSGSGKSSLVRAGLVPTLTQPGVVEGIGVWRWGILRPADSTGGWCDCIGAAICSPTALPELAEVGFSARELGVVLAEAPERIGDAIRKNLERIAEGLARQENLARVPAARLLLVVDQLEELFTRDAAASDGRRQFARALSALASSGSVWIVATMRSDFFSRLAELPELVELKADGGQFDLMPPTFAEIEQMIVYPARVAGLGFEVDESTQTSLDKLLHEAATRDPASLPLLEFSLDELYKRREGDLLTLAAYRRLGGLEGAIAQRAEEVFQRLEPPVQTALPDVLRGLLTLAADGAGTTTARRAPLDEVATSAEAQTLVDEFVQARLLVMDQAAAGRVVGVAHEALLLHWPRLRDWIANNQEFLRVRARATQAAELWQAKHRHVDYLLSAGKPLAEAEALVEHAKNLPPLLTEFVRQSAARRTGQMRHRRWIIGSVAGSFLVLSLVFGLYSFSQWQTADSLRVDAENQRQLAVDRERDANEQRGIAEQQRALAVEQQQEAETQRALAVAREQEAQRLRELEAEATRSMAEARAQAEYFLNFRSTTLAHRAWEANDFASARQWLASVPLADRQWEWHFVDRLCHCELRSLKHTGAVVSARMAPTGSRMVVCVQNTNGGGSELAVWDWDRGEEIGRFELAAGDLQTAVVMSRGEEALYGTNEEFGVLRVSDGTVVRQWSTGGAELVAISADGTRCAAVRSTGSFDEPTFEITVWDASNGQEIKRWSHDGRLGQEFVLSPEGDRVAVSVDYETVIVWETSSGDVVFSTPDVGESTIHHTVFAIDISPDGRHLALGRLDGTAIVWPLSASGLPIYLTQHDSAVTDVRFDQSSERLATASWDQTARVWDWEHSTLERVMRGHEEWLLAVDFSASGNTLASGSRDGDVKLWDTRAQAQPVQKFNHVAIDVFGVSYDARERTWVSAVFDERGNSLIVGNLANGSIFYGGQSGSGFCALNGDASLVATAGPGDDENAVCIWKLSSASFTGVSTELVAQLTGHDRTVTCGCFLPGVNELVTGSHDGTVRHWDVATQTCRRVLTGHRGSVLAVACSPTGRVFSAGPDGEVLAWDPSSDEPVARFVAEGPVRALAVDRANRHLAVGGGAFGEPGFVEIWDAQSLAKIRSLAGNTRMVTCAAFHPEGKRLATGSFDRSIKLWDVDNGLEAFSLREHHREVSSLAFSPSGNKLISGDRGGSIVARDATPVSLPAASAPAGK